MKGMKELLLVALTAAPQAARAAAERRLLQDELPLLNLCESIHGQIENARTGLKSGMDQYGCLDAAVECSFDCINWYIDLINQCRPISNGQVTGYTMLDDYSNPYWTDADGNSQEFNGDYIRNLWVLDPNAAAQVNREVQHLKQCKTELDQLGTEFDEGAALWRWRNPATDTEFVGETYGRLWHLKTREDCAWGLGQTMNMAIFSSCGDWEAAFDGAAGAASCPANADMCSCLIPTARWQGKYNFGIDYGRCMRDFLNADDAGVYGADAVVRSRVNSNGMCELPESPSLECKLSGDDMFPFLPTSRVPDEEDPEKNPEKNEQQDEQGADSNEEASAAGRLGAAALALAVAALW